MIFGQVISGMVRSSSPSMGSKSLGGFYGGGRNCEDVKLRSGLFFVKDTLESCWGFPFGFIFSNFSNLDALGRGKEDGRSGYQWW